VSRYDIAIRKPPEKESFFKKFFQKDTRDQLVKPFNKDSTREQDPVRGVNATRGIQDSSAFLDMVNAIRNVNTTRNELGTQGLTGSQGLTGLQVSGDTSGASRTRIPLQTVNPWGETTGFVAGTGNGVEVVASTGNGVEVRVPISQFLTITGPNGYRLLLPLRALQHIISVDGALTIRLTNNQAGSLDNDITAGKERLGL